MTNLPDRLVLFDGVCNLCTWSVKFLMKRDHREKFRYASLQSKTGQQVMNAYFTGDNVPDSIVYYRLGKLFTRSGAVLEILRDLQKGWQMLYVFKLFPAFLRDSIYHWIAKKRYHIFGKKEVCYIPEKPVKHLFYDD